ncbi:SOS response-associated peptidase [Variovorax ginsengisoli]|uniref:Abasic site processing protein n=1 Tax=Variovorax guangxiensis TaxID=1775474 RepID=A0A502DMM8_9BURK|nr:SOS response-associated peptidase family protein [Variovorax guangxiensis]TPG21391.1 SOS response-associated peptidase [Variovorax ginsengisoli]TPG25441.1 SOS response-associated peptidase [Variovorax guangxiensis]
MCARYESPLRFLFVDHDGVGVEIDSPVQDELFPRKEGYFVRRPLAADTGDDAVPRVEPVTGRWGLISRLTRPDNLANAEKLATHNARDDRVAKSFTFGNAWRKAQHCIVPAQAFWEPDWRTGAHIPTRFTAVDGEPFGIAGLWDTYKDESGALRESYTMLTTNADTHPLLRDYHRIKDEKRMLVLLPRAQWAEWLDAPVDSSVGFVSQYPAERMTATGHPAAPKTKAVPAKRAAPKPLPIQGELL